MVPGKCCEPLPRPIRLDRRRIMDTVPPTGPRRPLYEAPRTILGTKIRISDQITLSIRLDRTLVIEIGTGVVVIFSAEEAREITNYLSHFQRYFILPNERTNRP